MDFIRTEKSTPGYNPNLKHCMYGLDADLVSLKCAILFLYKNMYSYYI